MLTRTTSRKEYFANERPKQEQDEQYHAGGRGFFFFVPPMELGFRGLGPQPGNLRLPTRGLVLKPQAIYSIPWYPRVPFVI